MYLCQHNYNYLCANLYSEISLHLSEALFYEMEYLFRIAAQRLCCAYFFLLTYISFAKVSIQMFTIDSSLEKYISAPLADIFPVVSTFGFYIQSILFSYYMKYKREFCLNRYTNSHRIESTIRTVCAFRVLNPYQ